VHVTATVFLKLVYFFIILFGIPLQCHRLATYSLDRLNARNKIHKNEGHFTEQTRLWRPYQLNGASPAVTTHIPEAPLSNPSRPQPIQYSMVEKDTRFETLDTAIQSRGLQIGLLVMFSHRSKHLAG